MREIKFRAWCYINNKMYYQHIDGMTQVNGIDGSGNSDYHVATIRFSKEITPGHDDIDLMQYTGLKDKNGKEIYIGDIVCEKRNNNKIFFEVVETDYLGFYFKNDVYGHDNEDGYNVEVIGNIYENPDLLGGKE